MYIHCKLAITIKVNKMCLDKPNFCTFQQDNDYSSNFHNILNNYL